MIDSAVKLFEVILTDWETQKREVYQISIVELTELFLKGKFGSGKSYGAEMAHVVIRKHNNQKVKTIADIFS